MTTFKSQDRTAPYYFAITSRGLFSSEEAYLNHYAELSTSGIHAIVLREKALSSGELYDLGRNLIDRMNRSEVSLIISDRVDVALALQADGVHLTESSLSIEQTRRITNTRFLIGKSCHDLKGAQAAAVQGADYFFISPIYSPLSKATDAKPLGTEKLGEDYSSLGTPGIALGGIDLNNYRRVLETGIQGIASITMFAKANPSEVVELLRGVT